MSKAVTLRKRHIVWKINREPYSEARLASRTTYLLYSSIQATSYSAIIYILDRSLYPGPLVNQYFDSFAQRRLTVWTLQVIT